MSQYRVTDVATLEALLGLPSPRTAEKNQPHLNAAATAFLARCPFAVLSTADAQGRMDASPKGDAPGFIHIESDRSIVLPDRPGNRLAYGLRNILTNPRVGLLCMVPNTAETLRINGRAEIDAEPALLQQLGARGRPATLAIRIAVEECFFHCAKAFIRSNLWNPTSWPAQDRISFGRLFADMQGGDDAMARAIDAGIEENYRTEL
ncbi:MAG: pyridoxamine 5'-phosphate oxidase family protein [Pseudomonadales bacterium]|nr:pyridoxamine 5'-phosphate oxidase family protein [Pseudomonadales bacterium]MCP5186099.1 pyridoxamine 5'-phosphate oxidase family protein [Pseudomonadales bacterium]